MQSLGGSVASDLHDSQEPVTLTAGQGDVVRKYDIVLDLLQAALIHADWQLPKSGPGHDLLHLDDWVPREYDPVAWVFEHAWHGNVEYKWDPLVAAFGATAPTAR